MWEHFTFSKKVDLNKLWAMCEKRPWPEFYSQFTARHPSLFKELKDFKKANSSSDTRVTINMQDVFHVCHPGMTFGCIVCGKLTAFCKDRRLRIGYRPVCSAACNNKNPEVQLKKLQTLASRTPEFKKDLETRKRKTLEKRYGPDYRSRILAATAKTFKERYEGGHPAKDPKIKKKTQETLLARYGVTSSVCIPGVRDKQKSAYEKAQHSGKFARKLFTDARGHQHKLQGYEPDVMKWFQDSENFLGFESGRAVPAIEYVFNGKTKTYYPDFLMHTTRGTYIVEVKSSFTLLFGNNSAVNMMKFCAATRYARARGWNYLVVVKTRHLGIRWFKNPKTLWDFYSLLSTL